MTDDNTRMCPICGQEAREITSGAAIAVRCGQCGDYDMDRALSRTSLRGPASDPEVQALLPYLAAYIRQANVRGEDVTLTADNWRDFALSHKATPVSRKVMKLLELTASRAQPGTTVEFHPRVDPPLVDAASDSELQFLLHHLKNIGYLNRNGDWTYHVAVKGWERLEAASSHGIPGKCFIAMSFHPDLKTAYENGIYPAIKDDCKMDPLRIDLVHHNENISDKIIAEIRSCQFMVADFTDQRQAVYFEAGFAMGLGRPVVWTCWENDFDNVHFDTKQYNHLRWKTPQDLRVQLTDRIRATIPGAAG